MTGWKPEGDKVTRFMPLVARYEQGLVHHAEDLPREFRNESLALPARGNGHDDFVDAASCAYHGIAMASGKIASAGKSEIARVLPQMPGSQYSHRRLIHATRNAARKRLCRSR